MAFLGGRLAFDLLPENGSVRALTFASGEERQGRAWESVFCFINWTRTDVEDMGNSVPDSQVSNALEKRTVFHGSDWTKFI